MFPKWNIPHDSKNGIIRCVSKMEYSIRFQLDSKNGIISFRCQNRIFHMIPIFHRFEEDICIIRSFIHSVCSNLSNAAELLILTLQAKTPLLLAVFALCSNVCYNCTQLQTLQAQTPRSTNLLANAASPDSSLGKAAHSHSVCYNVLSCKRCKPRLLDRRSCSFSQCLLSCKRCKPRPLARRSCSCSQCLRYSVTNAAVFTVAKAPHSTSCSTQSLLSKRGPGFSFSVFARMQTLQAKGSSCLNVCSTQCNCKRCGPSTSHSRCLPNCKRCRPSPDSAHRRLFLSVCLLNTNCKRFRSACSPVFAQSIQLQTLQAKGSHLSTQSLSTQELSI